MVQNFTVYGSREGLKYKWTQKPYGLVDPDHYHTEYNIIELNETTFIANVSLTIQDIIGTDEGYYEVTLSNDCTQNCSLFRLRIPDCPESIPPEPSQPQYSYVVAQPRIEKVFCMTVAFSGNNDKSKYNVYWEDSIGPVCVDSQQKEGYTCNRVDRELDCTMVTELCIANLTTRQLTVYAKAVNSGDTDGNSSDIDISKSWQK